MQDDNWSFIEFALQFSTQCVEKKYKRLKWNFDHLKVFIFIEMNLKH